MLIVHVLRDLLRVTASLDGVVLIHSLGLRKLVNLATHKASEKFLGELVRDGLAYTVLGLEAMMERDKTCLLCVGGPRRASYPQRRQHLRSAHGRTLPGSHSLGCLGRPVDCRPAGEHLELRLERKRSVEARYSGKVSSKEGPGEHLPQPNMLDSSYRESG